MRRILWLLGVMAIFLSTAVRCEDAAVAPPGEQSPRAGNPIDIVFLEKAYPESEPLSLLQSNPADNGIAGAKLAAQEINITGNLIGRQFALNVEKLPMDADVATRARQILARGPVAIVANLDPGDLQAVASLPEAKQALILDARTIDDRLRQEDCRTNVFHILPSRAMRTDAIAQFLAAKRWRRWFLLRGPGANNEAYATDVRRSAARFGGKVVEERSYDYQPGARRVDTGYQQIQSQMPLATQSVPAYDVLFVADESGLFGDYLPYNTYEARPIVGTQGLVATAWHASFQEYSALQMQHRFKLFAHREMTERDYAAWLALRIVGEAIVRSGKSEPRELSAFLRSDQFEVAGFKGQALTFRSWDQQLRQPVLLAQALMVVSLSPQEGFLHQKFLTDTLGFDEPETKCVLAP